MATKIDVLEADGIRVSYSQRRLLHDVYIRAQTGTITGIFGRNGCGKSTLLQILFGARRVADASVRLNGHYTPSAFRIAGLINYLPQQPLFPSQLTVQRAASMLGTDLKQAFARFPELREQQHCLISNLSGGSTRLLEVLLLLYADTRFTLLDEPFTGVMPVHVEVLQDCLRAQKKYKGIILTDHRYTDVSPVCDVWYAMREGKLHHLDDPTQLLDFGYIL